MDGWAINGSGPWTADRQAAAAWRRARPASSPPVAWFRPAQLQSCARKAAWSPGTNGRLSTQADAKPGEHSAGPAHSSCRRRGLSRRSPDTRRHVLNPAHLALAAVAGHDQVRVQRKPSGRRRTDRLGGGDLRRSCPGTGPRHVRPAAGRSHFATGRRAGRLTRIGDSYDEWLAALEASGADRRRAAGRRSSPPEGPANPAPTTSGRRGRARRTAAPGRRRHAPRTSCRPGRTS